MKKLVMLVAALYATLSLMAETETVGEYTWTYLINGDTAEIYNNGSVAISPSPTGAVTIPSTLGGMPVTSIGYAAFRGCTGLTSVTIPGSVTMIGYDVFYGCSGLTSVTIPDSVTFIGYGAFEECNESLYDTTTIPDVRLVDGWAIGYTDGLEGELNLVGVRGIGAEAFYGCSGLTSVVIPDSVTSIGYGAFSECVGLRSVTLNQYVCNNMYIMSEVFSSVCQSITNIAISSGVTYISGSAFKGCSSLMSFEVSADNQYYKSVDGLVLSKDGSRLVVVPGGLTSLAIPDSVTSIDSGAFSGCIWLADDDGFIVIGDVLYGYVGEAADVTIPDGVTRIDEYAFRDCYWLASVAMPNCVTDIGHGAFWGCSGLTSVTIPSSVMSIGGQAFFGCCFTSVTIPNNVKRVDREAFSGCTQLRTFIVEEGNGVYTSENGLLLSKDRKKLVCGVNGDVVIPDGVTSIEPDAFLHLIGLIGVLMPDSVECIGDHAFYGCTGLTSVTIPDGVTSIGDYAFDECYSLMDVSIPDSVTSIGWWAFDKCNRALYDITTIPNVILVDGWIVGHDDGLFGTLDLTGARGIGDRVFCDCSGLTDVTIGNGMTSIGNSVFSGCTGLVGVTMPDSVTSIGRYAFSSCRSLMSVTIPDSVTSIESGAFSGCSSLTSVTIPDSVTNIGDNAFNGCRSLTSVTIPEGVTSIGSYAFYGCSGLTSVTIPDSVTSIGSYAFYNCTNLTSVTIGQGVTSIEYGVFYGCSGLTSVTIPQYVCSSSMSSVFAYPVYQAITNVVISDGVTNIGHYAFSSCRSLMSVTIPDSVTSIGSGAFSGCSSLTSVTIPDSVTSIGGDAFNGCRSLTSVTIPEGVTSIDTGAFSGCSSLASVAIPNSVTNIGWYAFNGCDSLTSVTIPDSVTSMSYRAFNNCTNLTNVAIPQCICSSSLNYLFASSYQSITNVVISDSVTNINSGAFNGCSSLVAISVGSGNANYASENGLLLSKDGKTLLCGINGDVVIPDGVTSIGDRAFDGFRGLASVVIPASVTSIGDLAFCNCSGLATIEVAAENPAYKSVDGLLLTKDGTTILAASAALTSVTIPDSVTWIPGGVFSGCSALRSVTLNQYACNYMSYVFSSACQSITNIAISSAVTYISGSAFKGCSSLLSFDVSADNQYYKSVDGLVLSKDGSRLVAVPAGLTSLTIPDSVTSIDSDALSGCTGLADADGFIVIGGVLYGYVGEAADVVIPNGVTRIEEYAFRGCNWLTSVTMPGSVTRIGNYAFSGCSGLADVTMPISVTNIGYSAFYGCRNLAMVTIPCGVTRINSQTFENCTSLTTVTIPEGVTTIGSYAFYGCTGLTSVTISEGVTTIGHGAFSGCTGLSGITIPDSVTYIGSGAFSGCTGLTSVTIPDSVMDIESSAFSGCTGLVDADGFIIVRSVLYGYVGDAAEVTIPDGVTSIGSSAFSGCTSLTSVTIPDSVTSIGEAVFSGCDNLESIDVSDESPAYKSVNGMLLTKDGSRIVAVPGAIGEAVIPDGVTRIEGGTFEGCGSLTSVTIPDSVTSIGYEAFFGCGSLKDVTIPDGVTSIGDGAFACCAGLMSVTIPDSVTSIGGWAFAECDEALYDTTAIPGVWLVDGWVISGADDVAGDLDLTGARGICRYAFSCREDLTSVTIGSGVKSIGSNAFEDCNSLTNVTISDSVTYIGSYAFNGCTSLMSVTIPDSVTCIGSYSFNGCNDALYDTTTIPGAWLVDGWIVGRFAEELSGDLELTGVRGICSYAFDGCGITSVTIPANVTSIGYDVFMYCRRLEAIEVAADNPAYKSVDGLLLTKDGRTLISVPCAKTSVNVPAGVRTIGSSAFACCVNMTDVTLPNGLASIEDDAFFCCSRLGDITMPASLNYIGKWVFCEDCDDLTNVVFSGDAPVVGEGGFDAVNPGCVVYVPRKAKGFSPDSQGKWNGMTLLRYADDEMRKLVYPEVSDNIVFLNDAGWVMDAETRFSGSYSLRSGELPPAEWQEEPTTTNTTLTAMVVGEGSGSFRWKVACEEMDEEYDEWYDYAVFSIDGVEVAKIAGDSGWQEVEYTVKGEGEHVLSWSFVRDAWDEPGAEWPNHVWLDEVVWNKVWTLDEAICGYDDAMATTTGGASAWTVDATTGWQNGVSVRSGAVASGQASWIETSVKGLGTLSFAWKVAGGIYRGKPFAYAQVKVDGVEVTNDCQTVGWKAISLPITGDDGAQHTIRWTYLRTSSRVADGDCAWVSGVDWTPSSVQDVPSVPGDPDAVVTGDATIGYTVKPSAASGVVEVTIPDGVDAAKVTVEVSPTVESVTPHGAAIKIVKGGHDITDLLDIPAADGNGAVATQLATVKEAIVKEPLDTTKGAEIDLKPSAPSITTAPTRPGLTYTFREGTTIEGMTQKAEKQGDGQPWTPTISVKDGPSGFYSIGVGK